jgi:hypothetical protein
MYDRCLGPGIIQTSHTTPSKEHLGAHNIAYLFLGEELGGRPNDDGCYDEWGRA